MKPRWSQGLQHAREKVGITQRQLGELAGVSPETVRAYERGSRSPRRHNLVAVLDALSVDQAQRNRILEAAGFSSTRTLFPSDEYPNYFFTVEELQKEVELVAWPGFVLNNANEVVAANAAVQAIWGIDFQQLRKTSSGAELNLLSVASQRRFADRVLNWDECVGTLAAVFKGRPVNPASLDEPDPYFHRVLQEFADGDPQFLSRLVRVWMETPARAAKVRWGYNVVWQDPEFGVVRFQAMVGTASEPDGLAFNDWMPLDAESWNVLEQVKLRELKHRQVRPTSR